MIRLVLASANPDKVAEIEAVFGDAVELVPRPADLDDVIEDADTLVGNARLKARAVCRHVGQPAVADDTGLEVDALGGQPGVHTSRFAGEDATYAENVTKLLATLAGLPQHERNARFRTVALVAYPDGNELVAEGIVRGHIATEARGGGGFGYDPVFIPTEGDGRTFAEMGDEKHEISHRGRAFRVLAAALTGRAD